MISLLNSINYQQYHGKIEDIARDVIMKELTTDNLRKVLNKIFEDVTVEYNLRRDYQARAVRFGEALAYLKIIMKVFFLTLGLEQIPLPDACMMDGERLTLQ